MAHGPESVAVERLKINYDIRNLVRFTKLKNSVPFRLWCGLITIIHAVKKFYHLT